MLRKQLILFLIITTWVVFLGSCINEKEETTYVLSNDPDWSVVVPSRILSCHLYKESNILIQTTNEVLLLETKTGQTVWVNHLPDYYVIDDKSATLVGSQIKNNIFVTHRGDGAIQAIDADTGKVIWEDLSKVGGTIDSIYINSEVVVAAFANDKIIAYDIYTGEIKWNISAPSRTRLYLFGSKEKIFLGTGHEIYDVSAGILSVPVQLDGLVNEMKPASGELFISYIDGDISFSSLSLPFFQPLWRIEKNTVTPLTSITASVLVDSNTVYFIGEDIVAIEKTNGALSWRSNYNDEFSRPVILGDYLFAQGRQRLYVLDKKDGKEIQTVNLKGGFRLFEWIMYERVNPCANNNTVWVARGVNLYAYNLKK